MLGLWPVLVGPVCGGVQGRTAVPMVRQKIKWPTKRRKTGSRQWKTKWVSVWKPDKPGEKSDKK